MAQKFKTRGLILREMSLGESDRLVWVLTEDRGLVRAFARRAKNIRDSKNAGTSLFCYSRLELYKGRDKYIVNSAIPIEAFFGLRSDLMALSLAQYLCELGGELVPEGVESSEPLRLILNTLHFLSEGSRPAGLLKALCELRLISLSGYMPDLVGCAACGKYQSERMFFRLGRGELYCQDCYKSGGTPAVALSPAALTAMRHIIYSPFEKLFAFTLSPAPLKELGEAAEAYCIQILQKRPVSLDFYHSLL